MNFSSFTQSFLLKQGIEVVIWRLTALFLGAAGSIWAARCLGPENLGISTMLLSIIAPLALLVNLNINSSLVRSIVTASSETEKFSIIQAITTFRFLVTLSFMFLALMVILFFDFSDQWNLGLFVFIPLLFFSCNKAIWILQAQEKMPINYKALTIQSFISTLLYFSFFRPGIAAGSDLVVQLIALSVSYGITWFVALKSYKSIPIHFASIKKVWPIFKEGKWLIPLGILAFLSDKIDQPLIGYLYSIEELGQYKSALLLINPIHSCLFMLPLVLYPRFIIWNKENPTLLWRYQVKFSSIIITGGAVIVIALTGFAPLLFEYLFGNQFVNAAYPFLILLFAKFIALSTNIFQLGLLARKKDRSIFFLSFFIVCLSLPLNLFFIPKFGMYGSSFIYLLTQSILLFLSFLLSRHLAKKDI